VLVPSNTNPLPPAAVVVAPTAAVVTVLAPTSPPLSLVAAAAPPPAPTSTPSLTVPAVITWLIVPLHAAPTRQQATWPA